MVLKREDLNWKARAVAAVTSELNLPAPEKDDSTLAAAAFLQPTSARKAA